MACTLSFGESMKSGAPITIPALQGMAKVLSAYCSLPSSGVLSIFQWVVGSRPASISTSLHSIIEALARHPHERTGLMRNRIYDQNFTVTTALLPSVSEGLRAASTTPLDDLLTGQTSEKLGKLYESIRKKVTTVPTLP